MPARFEFEHSLAFAPDNATEILRSIPTLPGVFALHGPPAPAGQPPAQPYLTRAADLRRRITRILAPPDSQSKRLNLRSRVARIDYTVTGSEFESTLTLYHASAAVFGLDEARRRLRLRTPFFLRFTAENAYPRVYSTNRLSKRALANFYGPFPSRAAADRYCDAVLDLFKLRRCVEDLAPYPEHPGCVYGEMNKCLAPCNQACTPAGAAAYAAEAAAVHAFFETHGESMLAPLTADREAASAELDFERAAELHAQWQKVKAAAALADPLVQPIPRLRAIILQKPAAAPPTRTSDKSGAPHLASEMWVAVPPTSTPVILSNNPVILSGAQSAESKDPRLPSQDSAEPNQPSYEVVILSVANGAPGQLAGWGGKNPRISLEAPQRPVFNSAEPAAVFLLHSGCLTGPARLSALGVRAVKEQTSVGSSLFAQPLMLQAIPLEEESPNVASGDAISQSSVILSGDATAVASQSKDPEESPPATIVPTLSAIDSIPAAPALNPEAHAAALITALEEQATSPTAGAAHPDLATLSDHLSLLRRWYYRPEKQRTGEVFFPREDSADQITWPIRRILNGAARLSLGDPKPTAETQRDLAQGNAATRNPADAAQKPTRKIHKSQPT